MLSSVSTPSKLLDVGYLTRSAPGATQHTPHVLYKARRCEGFSPVSICRAASRQNDERVADVIRLGRGKMPGYSRVLNDQQINDLIVYLHTL